MSECTSETIWDILINRPATSVEFQRAKALANAAPELLAALKNIVSSRPAFRLKPIGAPNSVARIEQEQEIRLEDEALAIIAKAEGVI